MATTSNVEVTISLAELGLDNEDLQAAAENLRVQLKEVDGVEEADLVDVADVPKGAKAFGGFELGWLITLVKADNIKALFGFLRDRFGNKPIKLVVKAPDGRELTIEASSREEFEFAIQQAEDFLKNTK